MSNYSYFKVKEFTMQHLRDQLNVPKDDYIAEITPIWDAPRYKWVLTFRINTDDQDRAKMKENTILHNPAELDFRKPNTNIRSRQQRPSHQPR
jgi:hypothetical protein